MGAAANSPLRRRRVFWVLAVYCLALVAAVAWSVTRAVHLLSGPSVILPGDGYAAVAVSPDGRTLYAANPGPGSNDSGHTVTPVDIATGNAGKPITVGTGPQELAVTPDGRMLYALLSDGTIAPVNLATSRTMAQIHVISGAAVMAVSPDSRTLFIGTGNNEVVAVDIAAGRRGSVIPLPTTNSVVSPVAMGSFQPELAGQRGWCEPGWWCSCWWGRLGVGHDRLSAGDVLVLPSVSSEVIMGFGRRVWVLRRIWRSRTVTDARRRFTGRQGAIDMIIPRSWQRILGGAGGVLTWEIFGGRSFVSVILLGLGGFAAGYLAVLVMQRAARVAC